MRAAAVISPVTIVVWTILASACTSDPAAIAHDAGSDSAAPDAGAPPPRDAALDAPASTADSITLPFGPDPIAIGDERTVCVTLDVNNASPRQVRAIRTHLPQGSHHMIVYRSSQPVSPTPTPCFPFADGAEAVFIAESVEGELVYPDDAALAFEAHQHVRLEIHEVNYTGAPLDITAAVTFDFLPVEADPRTPVQFLFTGDMSISLPPHQTTTIQSFHTVPDGARIFALTSHTHGLGTHASIRDATSASDTTGELLHESTNWAEPPLSTFAPARVLAAGRGLRLSCTYENTRSETVSFGLGFDDEMCFLWAYWY